MEVLLFSAEDSIHHTITACCGVSIITPYVLYTGDTGYILFFQKDKWRGRQT